MTEEPENEAAPAEETPTTEEQPQAKNNGGLIKGSLILVVDDSSTIRRFLKTTLSSMKAAVDEAENGQVALDKIRAGVKTGQPYSMAIVDLDMPVMNGYDLLRNVRSDPEIASLPIVVHSTETERSRIIECAKYGLASFIIKPSKTERIQEAVVNALLTGDAGEKKSVAGLTPADVEALRQTLLDAAAAAIESGQSAADVPENDLIVQAAMKFLDDRA